MNTLDHKIKELEENNQLGLMAHAVIGYPTISDSEELIKALVNAGCDFLELQIPFSDPVADGETIMKACETALGNGMNTDKAFEMISDVMLNLFQHPQKIPKPIRQAQGPEYIEGQVRDDNLPIIIMAYYNTVFRYGTERFCQRASKLGVSGLIVPDIPPEEESGEKFISTCLRYDLYPIRVVSPSSSIERLGINARFAKGFVYCVSHFGVTGSQAKVDSALFNYLTKVKQITKLPVAVGFGIEKKEQIKKLKGIADIAIVGSAIIKNYDKGGIKKVSSFIKQLKESTI